MLLRCALAALLLAVPEAAWATPQFARRHGVTCNACHAVVPRLNEHGLAFVAGGYRLPEPLAAHARTPDSAAADRPGLPLATWITIRAEDRGGSNASDVFLPRVELISGGRLSPSLAYFAEWRLVSLSLNNDGSTTDRGGRFEDLFLDWGFADRHTLKVGQFRSLNQVDVSQRLSPDEPVLFNNALPTGASPNPRLNALERFSPGARSPSIGWTWQSRQGATAADGLFHYVTVPFAGELSIPLGDEASERASFELGSPKGLYLETFHRRGLRSIGVHAFADEDVYLATLVGAYDWRDFVLTGGAGIDDQDATGSRRRGSLEVEYLWRRHARLRAAAGLRVEDVSTDGRRARWVPYVVFAGPNARHTFLLQLQYVNQEGSDNLLGDLSLIF